MRKKRLEILLITVAVLATSAGVVAGLLASRLPSAAGRQPAATDPSGAPPASFERTLADELQLRADQRDSMRQIWEGVRGKVHATFEEAQNLQRERDEALVALLNDEQRVKFAKISKDYANRFEALTQKRDKTFEEAVRKTRNMLDESQRQRYDEILKQHVRRGPPEGVPPPPGPPPGPAAAAPTTKPTL